ncbi:unnamed protein product [Periconia digitata]|uniref:C2H2-type domain-containing protein n=1 Tax=Periconia digitata TaxID=1303443 RepID=A0A9W4XIJ2_9PLEO|nr:unnamed protein product [Periconia digitata]
MHMMASKAASPNRVGSLASHPPARNPAPTLTPTAKQTFDTAFTKLQSTVRSTSIQDYHQFCSTTLQDVRDAARGIERQMAARQCLRNLRRLDVFLGALEHYSKAVEVLCNGTLYLPWIWAPIKLTIMIASDFLTAFETLMAAYARIAENLPRFDRLSNTLKHRAEFQNVLAVYYSDLLEFHHQAYVYVKRPAWKLLFSSCWGRFNSRFKCILDSLSRHSQLIDTEATSWEILESQEWRQKAKEEASRQDDDRAENHLQSSLSWLESGMDNHDRRDTQEDFLSELLACRQSGSHEWIVKNPKFRHWLNTKQGHAFLWLTGKPGSGKSVLSASVIRFLRLNRQSTVLFYYCSYLSSELNQSTRILKSLATQLLRLKTDLSSFVYSEFVTKGLTPSLQTLKEIVPPMLASMDRPCIIIDGIDECKEGKHKDVVRDILGLAPAEGTGVQILISSRDTRFIADALSKKPTLSLNDEAAAIGAAIDSYVSTRIEDMQGKFQELAVDDALITAITHQIVHKAEGMFLWVRLVLDVLEDEVFSVEDLRAAVEILPRGLKGFYERIMSRVQARSPRNAEKALRILQWIVFAKRPLRFFEILNALAFTRESGTMTQENLLSTVILQLCKPLIEQKHDGVVKLAHFSVREYLISDSSSHGLGYALSEHMLSFSCISYLNFSAKLIVGRMAMPVEEEDIQHQNTINIAKGMHGLHLYANEYWIEHLFSYLDANGGIHTDVEADCVLLVCLDNLTRIFRVNDTFYYRAPADHSTTALPDRRLELLTQYPDVMEIIRGQLEHRAEQEKEGSIIHDYTLFGEIRKTYYSKVATLLSSQEFPGLSADELQRFQAAYGPTALVCRFSNCIHATIGFPTESLRSEHEKTHLPKLFCSEPGCTYGLSFPSTRALKKHEKECHTESWMDIPISISKPRVAKLTAELRLPNGKYLCPHCKEYPSGFKAGSELRRHVERAHHPVRKGYICIDASPDKKLLANCKHCRYQKVYGAYYNAA